MGGAAWADKPSGGKSQRFVPNTGRSMKAM